MHLRTDVVQESSLTDLASGYSRRRESDRAALDKLFALTVGKLIEARDTRILHSTFWRPVIDPSFFAHENVT